MGGWKQGEVGARRSSGAGGGGVGGRGAECMFEIKTNKR